MRASPVVRTWPTARVWPQPRLWPAARKASAVRIALCCAAAAAIVPVAPAALAAHAPPVASVASVASTTHATGATHAASGPRTRTDCDRQCLIAMARLYAAALTAHEPGRLPVAPDMKFTENLVPLAFGREGLWRTVNGRRHYDIYAADTLTGNVVWIGIVKENDAPVMMAARLKVVDHRITEVETLVGRSPLSAAATVAAPRPQFAQRVPPSQRSSRAELIAIADSNWDAMEHGDGHLAPFAVDCERYDNGMQTTHGRSPGPGADRAVGDPAAGAHGANGPFAGAGAGADDRSCFGQMNSGRFDNGNRVDPRRIWAVDPQYGLVVGLFTPNVPGTVRRIRLRNGTMLTVPRSELAPFTIEQVEMFKIIGGQISKVEVVLGPRVPYGMRSPFDMATLWRERRP